MADATIIINASGRPNVYEKNATGGRDAFPWHGMKILFFDVTFSNPGVDDYRAGGFPLDLSPWGIRHVVQLGTVSPGWSVNAASERALYARLDIDNQTLKLHGLTGGNPELAGTVVLDSNDNLRCFAIGR